MAGGRCVDFSAAALKVALSFSGNLFTEFTPHLANFTPGAGMRRVPGKYTARAAAVFEPRRARAAWES